MISDETQMSAADALIVAEVLSRVGQQMRFICAIRV